jgi:hypothetical protein
VLGTYELTVATLSVLASLGAVGVCLYTKSYQRYVFLNLYLLANIAFTVGCYIVYSAYGYSSLEYYYFYYIGDAVPNIIGYLMIANFFDRLLRDSAFHKYVRPTLAIALLLVVGVSAVFVLGSMGRLYSRFVFELQQNLYFIGVLLTALLWISMSYLRAESRRFVLLVSGLGIYFTAHASNYAFQFLFPYKNVVEFMTHVPPLAYTVMVMLWFYTFWRVPEAEPVFESARGRPQEAFAQVKSQSG